MKKFLILVPFLFVGTYQTTSNFDRVEEFISVDTPIVVKIGNLSKAYDGFKNTRFGKLFTDKEIADFVNASEKLKEGFKLFNSKIEDFEKEVGAKFEDCVKSMNDVWVAMWPEKGHGVITVKFANKVAAEAAEKFAKSKAKKDEKVALSGTVLLFAGAGCEIPTKTSKNITTNEQYRKALKVVNPSDAALFAFINMESFAKKMSEHDKKVGFTCFKYFAYAIEPDGEIISQKFQLGIDYSEKGILPQLLKGPAGKASLKDVPTNALLAISSGLDISEGLKMLEAYFKEHDEEALKNMENDSNGLKFMLGVDLKEFVTLFDNINLYIATGKDLKLTDTVIGCKSGNAKLLKQMLEKFEQNGLVDKGKDENTYRFSKLQLPMPLNSFDKIAMKSDTLLLGGSYDGLKNFSGGNLTDDKEFKKLLGKGNDDAALVVYVNWELMMNYLKEMFGAFIMMAKGQLENEGIDIEKFPWKKVAQLLGKSVDCVKCNKDGITISSRSNNFLSTIPMLAAVAIPLMMARPSEQIPVPDKKWPMPGEK